MSQPVFLLIEAIPNPSEKEALQSYLTQAPAVTKEHGVVQVATYDVETVLDGGDKLVIMHSVFMSLMKSKVTKLVSAMFVQYQYRVLNKLPTA